MTMTRLACLKFSRLLQDLRRFFYPKRDPDLQLLLLHVSHFLIQYASTLTAGRKCLLTSFSTETHAAAAATVQLYIAADTKYYHPLCDSLSAMTCLVMPLFSFLCPGQKWFKPLSVVLAGKQLTHTARVMVANRNCYRSLLSGPNNIKTINLKGEADMYRSDPGLWARGLGNNEYAHSESKKREKIN